MKKGLVEFIVTVKKGVVTHIGNSVILVPKGNCNGDNIKWFDDSKLLKQK